MKRELPENYGEFLKKEEERLFLDLRSEFRAFERRRTQDAAGFSESDESATAHVRMTVIFASVNENHETFRTL